MIQRRKQTGYDGALAVAAGTPCSLPQYHPPHPQMPRAGSAPAPSEGLLPAHWAWETGEPFAAASVGVKDIRDEATLGSRLVHHLQDAHLPRYQWTFLEGRTRLRLLAFSRQNNLTKTLCFAGLVLFWLRSGGFSRSCSGRRIEAAHRVGRASPGSSASTGASSSPSESSGSTSPWATRATTAGWNAHIPPAMSICPC